MKRHITHGIITLMLVLGASTSFAQRDAGGSSGGTPVPAQPCPTEFTRNNGDGTCSGNAQIRLFFTQVPEFAPELISISYNGTELLSNPMPISGNIADINTKGYVSYCLPMANIPPAVKLTVTFRYSSTGQPDCVISGTN